MFEPRQGLHHARNRGILEAQGDIVVFGDDDIVAGAGWLTALLREFDSDPRVGVVGGKILPLWDRPPDPWIYDYGSDKIHPVFAYLDYGDERAELERQYLFGCNFAIRRMLAVTVGGSFPDTFPKRLRHLSGTGECAMTDRARERGYKVVYAPAALVHHHADASRASLAYFMERYRRWAVEEAFIQFRQQGRGPAALRLVHGALLRLALLPKACRGKRRPAYCAAIEAAVSLEMIMHVLRVLTRPALFRHIVQESYL
jgi:GT2 family glycosyltransferase